MKSYIYSHCGKILSYRDKIVNIRIGEFISLFTIVHHEERSKIIAIYHDGVIKRYFSEQIKPFLKQPSMLDEFIAKRKIEDRYDAPDQKKDEPLLGGDNVQLNIELQSY